MVEVKTSTPGLDRIEKEMNYLSKHGVKVGVLGDEKSEDGVTIKEYAGYLITGTKDKDGNQIMPPRDFMDSIRSIKSRYEIFRYQRKCLSMVFKGQINGRQCLNMIGIFCVQRLKQRILEGDFTPLAEATVKNKKRNKNNILRDSDFLYNSLMHEVIRL